LKALWHPHNNWDIFSIVKIFPLLHGMPQNESKTAIVITIRRFLQIPLIWTFHAICPAWCFLWTNILSSEEVEIWFIEFEKAYKHFKILTFS
jgi:hypothetical protein